MQLVTKSDQEIMDLVLDFEFRDGVKTSPSKKYFKGEWETNINVLITILRKLYLFDAKFDLVTCCIYGRRGRKLLQKEK